MLKKIINKESISWLLTMGFLLLSCYCIYTWVGVPTDAQKFKREYESLNGQVNEKNNKEYSSLSIEKDNPIVYLKADELVKKIDKGETFIVYFGFAECPWCRSVLGSLLRVAKDLKLDKIYYVDVQNIRDVKELDSSNKPVLKTEGTNSYKQLLVKLDAVLADYTLTDKDGNKVSAGEKRIYAPNVVAIVGGQPEKLATGISPFQTDAYMDLTESMLNDTYQAFKCVIKCVLDEENACHIGSSC